MTKYIAFLRGINVGGHKKVPMLQLRQCLTTIGFKNVKTLLASGNAVFDAEESDPQELKEKIMTALKLEFDFEIPVTIRTAEHIKKLAQRDPFKNIEIDQNTRLYVTFLSDKLHTSLKLPYKTPEGDYTLLAIADGEVCSVLRLKSGMGTTDSMDILEREFGKKITTRNWNTVMKLLKI